MAMWDVHQTTTRLDTGQQFGPDYLGEVDDEMEAVNGKLNSYFGNERNNVQYTSPSDGIVEAKIQYSPQNKQGWVRDNQTPYDYIVVFLAVRR
jgi:hypothetical protein